MNISYERLRDLLFRVKLKDHASSYFAQFLMRLGQTQQPDKYHEAASENIIACLKSDEKCLSVWEGKHQSSLKESQLLLDRILSGDSDDTKAVRRSKKLADFLDRIAELEPTKGKKEVGESFVEDHAAVVESAKKLKRRIKSEGRYSGFKKFFAFVFLIAAAVGGEIAYNSPKGSYAIQGYNVAKPLAIEYWSVAKPAVIRGWEEYVKPFSYWAAVESVHLAKYSLQLAANAWTSLKTNLPQVYGIFLLAQDYASQLTSQFGSLCLVGLRKVDHFLVDMPPLSQYAEKALPLFDYAREKLATSLVYMGHLVEQYMSGNATSPTNKGK